MQVMELSNEQGRANCSHQSWVSGDHLTHRSGSLHRWRRTGALCAESGHRPSFDVALQDAPEEKRDAAAKTKRILLVDDNVDAVQSLAKLLGLLGYDALATTSGAGALEQGPQFRPNVVLLDLGMPGMDGFETVARLRREAWGADVLLIALTGWGQPEDMRRTREAGFAAHFVKPLDLDALLDLLSAN